MGNVVLRTQQECEDLVRGLCFMGTGGGGVPRLGLRLLLDQLEAGREIEWVDPASLSSGAWVATVAGIGGMGREDRGTEEQLTRLGCIEEKYDFLGQVVAAVRALQESAGVEIEGIVPIEIGGRVVPVAIAAALELGVSAVDGDYAGGRAIPEISQVIPEIRGVPVCPMFVVTRWGDVVSLKETVSTSMADRIGRMMNLASYGLIGASWYLAQMEYVKEMLAAGTITRALRVGQVIRTAREQGGDPVAQAARALDCWVVFEGRVIATETLDEPASAFGFGTHSVEGLGSHQGHTFRIWYKNEYHVSWIDERPFVSSPDSLVMVDLRTGEPAISYDFSIGDEVAVLARRAHEAYRTTEGIEALGPRHFGFDFDYVPVEERLGDYAA